MRPAEKTVWQTNFKFTFFCHGPAINLSGTKNPGWQGHQYNQAQTNKGAL